jgi:hypothetical protein
MARDWRVIESVTTSPKSERWAPAAFHPMLGGNAAEKTHVYDARAEKVVDGAIHEI